jgi:hypothetical protein
MELNVSCPELIFDTSKLNCRFVSHHLSFLLRYSDETSYEMLPDASTSISVGLRATWRASEMNF